MAKESGHSVTLVAHGNGTYHTEEHGVPGSKPWEDGTVTEHPSFGHALMHIAKLHGPPGDHLYTHGHPEGYTTHHVLEGGPVKGPVEHDTVGELKKHVGDCMEEG